MAIDANYLRAQVGVQLISCLRIRISLLLKSEFLTLSRLEIRLQNAPAKSIWRMDSFAT